MASITVRSYAKINWSLEVLFRRSDGYHEIRTLLQTISLHDIIAISTTPKGDIEIACSDPLVPLDQSNLVHKAATALAAEAKSPPAVRIHIDKRIPVGGGLGGGSSNAAAALLALRRLWGVGVDDERLVRIAAGIGADVPFFLAGGTALGTGRGDQITPVADVECESLALANPGVLVRTADAYGVLRLTTPKANRIMPLNSLAAKGILEHAFSGRNDLEASVFACHPEIGEIKHRFFGLGARHALMSGSGSTVFGVFDNLQATDRAVAEMSAVGLWSQRVRTISRSEYRTSFGLIPQASSPDS